MGPLRGPDNIKYSDTHQPSYTGQLGCDGFISFMGSLRGPDNIKYSDTHANIIYKAIEL